MIIKLDKEGTVEKLKYFLEIMVADADTSGILILACEANGFTPKMVNELFEQCNKPIFGGIFSRIIYNREKLRKGTIVAGIYQPVTTTVIKNISNIIDLDAALEQAFEQQYLINKTIFVFVDGLSQRISELIESTFNYCGLSPNYIGGGAGSITIRQPCIICNKGLLEDASVFALTDIKSGIGVAHGWEPVVGPLKITEAEQQTIISLNWRPAFEVYRGIVEKLSGKSFDNTDFFQLAKEFPFGIVKMSQEMVVRDPIAVDDNKLICVGAIPLNSFVYILKGDKDSLIAGAIRARQLAEASYWQANSAKKDRSLTTFFMDCVSRVLFLQSAFDQELEAVQMEYPLLGALTLGEIANTGRNYLEFYNKTSVVGLLED